MYNLLLTYLLHCGTDGTQPRCRRGPICCIAHLKSCPGTYSIRSRHLSTLCRLPREWYVACHARITDSRFCCTHLSGRTHSLSLHLTPAGPQLCSPLEGFQMEKYLWHMPVSPILPNSTRGKLAHILLATHLLCASSIAARPYVVESSRVGDALDQPCRISHILPADLHRQAVGPQGCPPRSRNMHMCSVSELCELCAPHWKAAWYVVRYA